MNQEKDEMTEDSAVKANAGTELVFKAGHEIIYAFVAAMILYCAATLLIILGDGLERSHIILFLLFFFTMVWFCLNLWRYEVRISASTLTVRTFWRKRVIAYQDLRFIKWGWGRNLKVAYEDRGQNLHLRIRCGYMDFRVEHMLVNAIQEFWPKLLIE